MQAERAAATAARGASSGEGETRESAIADKSRRAADNAPLSLSSGAATLKAPPASHVFLRSRFLETFRDLPSYTLPSFSTSSFFSSSCRGCTDTALFPPRLRALRLHFTVDSFFLEESSRIEESTTPG